jgi:hypothetical protein
MKLTADDYRASYRVLSDEEFLAIDRDDLVDVARRVYDAELKRRQLEPMPAEDEPPLDTEPRREIATDEELVQVALVTAMDRATYAQRVLLDADIPCKLNHQPTMSGDYAAGSIGLMVPASCVEMAQELMAQNLSGDNQVLVRRWLEREWAPDDIELHDFSVTVEDVFGDADKVAARMTVRGVEPESGEAVEMDALAIVRMDGGAIAEHWVKL